MTVGVLTTVIHNTLQIAVYAFFLFNRTTLQVFDTSLQVLYMCTLKEGTPFSTHRFPRNTQILKKLHRFLLRLISQKSVAEYGKVPTEGQVYCQSAHFHDFQ